VTTDNGSAKIAEQFTKYLIEPNRDPYARDRTPPLEAMVQAELTAMARRIAVEIVAGIPDVEDVIRTRVHDTIARAMRDDVWLGKIVTEAVARALVSHFHDENPGQE